MLYVLFGIVLASGRDYGCDGVLEEYNAGMEEARKEFIDIPSVYPFSVSIGA